MPNPVKLAFLENLRRRFGVFRKLANSESLFEIAEGKARLYFRYSKKHPGSTTFFGLRKVDLQLLEGHNSVICFCWNDQPEPLFVPFEEFEETFAALTTASDGQYKVQVYEQVGGTVLYIANAGRFNVDSYLGWSYLDSRIGTLDEIRPELSHVQVQTLLGGIGDTKGFDVWVPSHDRGALDWNLTTRFELRNSLPPSLESVSPLPSSRASCLMSRRPGWRGERRWSCSSRSEGSTSSESGP